MGTRLYSKLVQSRDIKHIQQMSFWCIFGIIIDFPIPMGSFTHDYDYATAHSNHITYEVISKNNTTNILAEISLSSITTSVGLFIMMETPKWTPATVQLDKRADPCVLNPKPLRPPEIRVLTT